MKRIRNAALSALLVAGVFAATASPAAAAWPQNQWTTIGPYQPGSCVANLMIGRYGSQAYAKVQMWGAPYCSTVERVTITMTYQSTVTGQIQGADTCAVDRPSNHVSTVVHRDDNGICSDQGQTGGSEIAQTQGPGYIITATAVFYPFWNCTSGCPDKFSYSTTVTVSAV